VHTDYGHGGIVNDDAESVGVSLAPLTARERQQHAAVKLALGLLWRGGQRSRAVRRVAGSLDWVGYCAEIDALRERLRVEYAAAVDRGEIDRLDVTPDLEAALLLALHYFRAKETPPLPLPPGVLDSTGDLLKYFAQQALAGRWGLTS
jgi:hypothetical protein